MADQVIEGALEADFREIIMRALYRAEVSSDPYEMIANEALDAIRSLSNQESGNG